MQPAEDVDTSADVQVALAQHQSLRASEELDSQLLQDKILEIFQLSRIAAA